MTVASLVVSGPSAVGSAAVSGRNIYAEGNRWIGRFTITIKDLYETGGGSLNFDPRTLGFPTPVAQVFFSTRPLIANVALLRYTAFYDYVNKKIIIFDQTDHDEPNTDDLTGLVLDAVVIGE
jgi:hypothetical protein